MFACRRIRREPLRKGGPSFGKIKNSDGAGIFCPTFQSYAASDWTTRDAGITGTLPNPPAEIVDTYSRKLSSEVDHDRQAPVYAFNRKEAHVQDGEGFAVIWRNAQRARSELLGVWFLRLVRRLSRLSQAGWFKLGAPSPPSAERGESTQAG